MNYFAGRNTPRDELRLEAARMIKARGRRQFRQSFQRCMMEISYALRFVRHNQGALTTGILRRNTCRALIRMTGLRLNAANRKHEAAR
jgi:hypothetical protein